MTTLAYIAGEEWCGEEWRGVERRGVERRGLLVAMTGKRKSEVRGTGTRDRGQGITVP